MNRSKTFSAVALCLIVLMAPTHLARQANSATTKTSAAADLSGTWKFEVNFDDGRKGTPTFTFKQQGEQLTGTYQGGLGEAPVTGTVKGNDVTFAFKAKVEMEEREITVTFTGQVESAKTMKGTVKATALLPPGKWTATKQ